MFKHKVRPARRGQAHQAPYPGDLCKRKNTCKYAANGTNGGGPGRQYMVCYYAVLAGRSRGCPADKCDKYEPITNKEKMIREKTRLSGL